MKNLLKHSLVFSLTSVLLTSNLYTPNKVVIAEELSKNNVVLENQDNKDLENRSSEELSNEKTVVSKRKDGKYSVNFFDDIVQTKSGEDWEEVNPNFEEVSSDKFSTKSTDLLINFDSEIDSKTPMLVVGNQKNDIVTFTFKGMESNKRLIPINTSEGKITENKLTHEEILNDIDLRHTALNMEIKEDIILNKPTSEINSFVYEIQTKLKANLKKDGSISFTNLKGDMVYVMPAPMMSDSSINDKSGLSAESYDISYTLEPTQNGYELRLSPSKDWINDKDRVYPIYIDPSLAKDASLDTFISSASPETNFNKYWNSSLAEYVLRVGKYDSGTGTNYSFIKMPSLSDLKGANVSDAILKSFVKWSFYPETKTGIWVDSVNSNWSETELNWNSKPLSTNITSTTVSKNQWANFNVTSALKTIANGSRTDYGFKLHTNGNGQTYWKQLTASENSKNKTNLEITYSYPQMGSLKTDVFPSGAGATTGYIDLSWPSVKYATNYRLQLYNGKGWRTIYNGTSLKYSTKDKKIWPKLSQYSTRDDLTGGIAFRSGDGMELPMDPSPMYTQSSGVESTSKAYQFRVVADYKLGSSPVSKVTKQTLEGIIPDQPVAPKIIENVSFLEDEQGYFRVDWEQVEGANSYDLELFNGNNYERIPVGNVTSWSSKGKRIFPSEDELELLIPGTTKVFHSDFSGTDFLTNAKELYKKNGLSTTYHNTTNYYVKVVAKSSKGESTPSGFTRINFPMKKVEFGLESIRESENEQNIFLNWDSIDNAAGYLIYMYNGKTYQLVDDVSSNQLEWSTKNKKIWPKTDQGTLFRSKQKDGMDIPLNPESFYEKNGDLLNFKSDFSFKVLAYRGVNNAYVPFDNLYYIGLGDGFADYSSETSFSNNYVDTPEDFQVDENDLGNGKGAFNLSWSKVNNASGYTISIFNGQEFELFDVGNVETWTTSGKKIFPLDTEINASSFKLHKDNNGTDFDYDASKLYQNAKYFSDEDNMFQFKVTAYKDGISSKSSEVEYGTIDNNVEQPTDYSPKEVVGEEIYPEECPDMTTTAKCMLDIFNTNLEENQKAVDEIETLKKSMDSSYTPQSQDFKKEYRDILEGLQTKVASENVIDQITEIEAESKLSGLTGEEQLLSEEDDVVESSDFDVPLNLKIENLAKDSVAIAAIKSSYNNQPEETDLNALDQYTLFSRVDTYYTYNDRFIPAKEYLEILKKSESAATKQVVLKGLKITVKISYKADYDKKKKKYILNYNFSIDDEFGDVPKYYKVEREFLKRDSIFKTYTKLQKNKVKKKYVTHPKSKYAPAANIFDEVTINSTLFRNVKYTITAKGYKPMVQSTRVHLLNKKGSLYPPLDDPYTKKKLPYPHQTTYEKVTKKQAAEGRRQWKNYRTNYRKYYMNTYKGSPNGKGKTDWGGIDCHHIRQIDHGGSATDNKNIIPLIRKEHHTVTTWWSAY
ncbi:DNRLRE domain-containing protein [Exiguobacterium sp. s192]|uniref:DNRLRE domain-containing protein n=1 Tax=Exiguobacterium sp. s192 TaxID=2751206 RepID=UPI001BE8CA85|nr:DNRLRE domain-containing protein [Exiguobacterium sp. s192]